MSSWRINRRPPVAEATTEDLMNRTEVFFILIIRNDIHIFTIDWVNSPSRNWSRWVLLPGVPIAVVTCRCGRLHLSKNSYLPGRFQLHNFHFESLKCANVSVAHHKHNTRDGHSAEIREDPLLRMRTLQMFLTTSHQWSFNSAAH